jgi:uncharacterized protein (TIGR02246 family)
LASLWCGAISSPLVVGQEEPAIAEIRKDAEKLATAFSAGKAEEVAAMFLAKGELIDEVGTVYQGQQEIKDLVTAFFAKFPGAQMRNEIDSIRTVGPVAIVEGARITTAKDASIARIPFISVLAKTDQGWRIASMRDFADEAIASPGDMLKSLEWLVGDWINEGADARVKIAYRWSEDKNFILGDISATRDGQVAMKSSQRIGWDPIEGKVRSWIFDSDGGFSEATWTQLQDRWVVHSSAVMPDGLTGSATLTITPKDNGRYTIAGSNRIIGDVLEDDYEITIVKQPPTASQ